MIHSTLISVDDLVAGLSRPDWLVVDCRSDISDPGAGERAYRAGHIPGAVFADLNRDLSDLSLTGLGRHPLVSAAAFSSVLSRWGFEPGFQVICYDADNGSMAARLWWMLQAAGHRAAALLDGGFAAWRAVGGSVQNEIPARAASAVQLSFDPQCFVGFDELMPSSSSSAPLLIDARGAPRFRGEVEPIDPVAGHVPGALNRPFTENLDSAGRFKSPAQLHAEFAALLQSRPASDVVCMCGSGVTACHNLLALQHAGLSGARLFAPSWSGWISDPARPVAKGA